MVCRQVILIGKTGFLGGAIASQTQGSAHRWSEVIAPDSRKHVAALLQPSLRRQAVHSLAKPDVECDWIFAVGLVDPRANAEDLNRINVEAPLHLVDVLNREPLARRHRIITFGSVLERKPELAESNPYLRSKARLFYSWCQMHADLPLTWIHVQLHTLYGGVKLPHSAMFTGQMLAALVTGSQFTMSGGEQLREYHHVDDIAHSVLHFIATQSADSRTLELSSGQPIRLRDLAHAVFDHFHIPDRLSVGILPASAAEVYENEYKRSPHLLAYREPCAGVIAWFEALGVDKK
jgi:nucleoside-diphosphate-sugar epimerase